MQQGFTGSGFNGSGLKASNSANPIGQPLNPER